MKTEKTLKDIFQYILALAIIAGFFVLMIYVVKHAIPTENQALANQLFGALTLAVGIVVSYFFGSNKDSAKKTEMLYNSTPTAPVDEDTLDKAKADYLTTFGEASPLGSGMFEIREAIKSNTKLS